MKISIDLDDTVVSFYDHYVKIFGEPKTSLSITKMVRTELLKNEEFWLSQPLIHYPDFKPHCYCTARLISPYLIKKQLKINKLPDAPIYRVKGVALSKYWQLRKAGVDVHVDDSIRNFIDLNLKGVPCLLIDSPYNQEWGPIGRVYSLNKEEIEECYYLFKDTLFSYFRELVNGYLGT